MAHKWNPGDVFTVDGHVILVLKDDKYTHFTGNDTLGSVYSVASGWVNTKFVCNIPELIKNVGESDGT